MRASLTLLEWLDIASEQETKNHDFTKSLHKNAAARIRELEQVNNELKERLGWEKGEWHEPEWSRDA